MVVLEALATLVGLTSGALALNSFAFSSLEGVANCDTQSVKDKCAISTFDSECLIVSVTWSLVPFGEFDRRSTSGSWLSDDA